MKAQPVKEFVTEIQSLVNQSGHRRPASQIVQNLNAAAVASKLVKPREEPVTSLFSKGSEGSGMLHHGIDEISKSIMLRLEDNENIVRLFPDIELAIQIIISSVLSPKDMVKSELIYRLRDSTFPPALTAKVVDFLKDELKTHYGFEEESATILREALFTHGSSVKVTLPESAVDQIINKGQITTESINNTGLFQDIERGKFSSKGILGNPHIKQKRHFFMATENAVTAEEKEKGSMLFIPNDLKDAEGLVDVKKLCEVMTESIEIVDNYDALKLPSILTAYSAQELESERHGTLSKIVAQETVMYETGKKPSPEELSSMLYKTGQVDYHPFRVIDGKDNLRRKSVGRPLRINWPTEAAIPVFAPGNYREHIGYFAPIDYDGNPITLSSIGVAQGNQFSTLMSGDRSNISMSSLLTDKARRNIDSITATPMIDRMAELYAEIIERDLMERLAKGKYGRKLEVARNNEIYRIMLARSLQSQFTRMVYIPADYVSYYAFNFHRNGVGKSYLDDLANITSLRAMVLFSKVMAKVKSSIEVTDVKVTLDPKDPDPIKTMELAKHYVFRSRQSYFPHGLNRVVDLTDWMQRAGVQVSFEGHPGLPSTRFEFQSRNVQHQEPDDTLDEMFRHQTYMHFGLSPETVENAKVDFATTIEQNSILFARRILTLSNQFSRLLSEDARRIIRYDEVILKGLMDLFNEHKGDIEKNLTDEERQNRDENPVAFSKYLIETLLELFEVDLPKPEATRQTNQKTAFDSYSEMVDKALDFIFSSDIVPPELIGETNQYVDAVKAAWKGELMRRWMADNNFAPEVFDITSRDGDGQPMANLLEMVKSHSESVMLNVLGYLKQMRIPKAAGDKDVQDLNAGEGSSPSGSDSGGGSSGDDNTGDDNTGGEDSADEFGGMDVFDNPEEVSTDGEIAETGGDAAPKDDEPTT